MTRLSGRMRVLSEWRQGGHKLRLVGTKSGLDNRIERCEIFIYGAWFPLQAVIDE